MTLGKGESKIHGQGIFTDCSLTKGEEFYIIPLLKTANSPKPRWARLGDIWVLDNNVLAYINHSCSPNCYLNVANHSLVALRNISSNEELTCDYNITETYGNKVPCTCGSPVCRGFFLKVE